MLQMLKDTMVEERIYTVEEIARLLKVRPRTVRRWIIGGKLQAFRAGRDYRVTERNLEKFMHPER